MDDNIEIIEVIDYHDDEEIHHDVNQDVDDIASKKIIEDIRSNYSNKQKIMLDQYQSIIDNGFMMTPRVLSETEKAYYRLHG